MVKWYCTYNSNTNHTRNQLCSPHRTECCRLLLKSESRVNRDVTLQLRHVRVLQVCTYLNRSAARFFKRLTAPVMRKRTEDVLYVRNEDVEQLQPAGTTDEGRDKNLS